MSAISTSCWHKRIFWSWLVVLASPYCTVRLCYTKLRTHNINIKPSHDHLHRSLLQLLKQKRNKFKKKRLYQCNKGYIIAPHPPNSCLCRQTKRQTDFVMFSSNRLHRMQPKNDSLPLCLSNPPFVFLYHTSKTYKENINKHTTVLINWYSFVSLLWTKLLEIRC